MSFSDKLKEARKYRGLTQAQLAEKCNLATGTIQQYELGKRNPTKKNIKRIAESLNLGYSFSKEGEVSFYPFTDTTEPPQNIINTAQDNISNPEYKRGSFNLQLFASNTSAGDKIISQIDKLNETGQQKALEQLELLTKIQEYLK